MKNSLCVAMSKHSRLLSMQGHNSGESLDGAQREELCLGENCRGSTVGGCNLTGQLLVWNLESNKVALLVTK